MPDIAEQEIASIRAKHDNHDMKGALDEVRADWEKHKANPAEQTALAQKLISAGLMTDLALQYEKENLLVTPSHTDSRSHIRELAQIATGANDTLGATMLHDLDAHWDKVAPKNSNILSESQIDADLKTSALNTDTAALVKPFRDDPSLFDKLKEHGHGRGVFHPGEISSRSIENALKNPNSGLTDAQKAAARALQANFDEPSARQIEEGNFIEGRWITAASLKQYMNDHSLAAPDATIPPGAQTPPRPDATIPPGAQTPPRPDASIPTGAQTPPRPDATIPPGAQTPPRPDASTPPGAQTPPRPDANTPLGAQTPPRPDASTPPGAQTPPRPDATIPPGAQTPPRPDASTPLGASAPERQGRSVPTADQIKAALTVRNGEGPYQSAARLRELYGLPEDPHKTLALAHEIAKKMNSPRFYSHGQVLDAPANPDPELPPESARRPGHTPRALPPSGTRRRAASA